MMQTQKIPETVRWPTLPLAVYREVAAHLRQVIGLDVELLPQTALQFDYTLSQVGGLRLSGASDLSAASQKRVLEILQYYGHRFGPWQGLADEGPKSQGIAPRRVSNPNPDATK